MNLVPIGTSDCNESKWYIHQAHIRRKRNGFIVTISPVTEPVHGEVWAHKRLKPFWVGPVRKIFYQIVN